MWFFQHMWQASSIWWRYIVVQMEVSYMYQYYQYPILRHLEIIHHLLFIKIIYVKDQVRFPKMTNFQFFFSLYITSTNLISSPWKKFFETAPISPFPLLPLFLIGVVVRTPRSHRPKQGSNFAWGQQSGAWGASWKRKFAWGEGNFLLGVCLG